MKSSIWDILTGIVLLGILCLIIGFGVVLLNPGLGLSPAASPGGLVPTISLPTDTPLFSGLPPTWTPTPSGAQPENVITNTPEPGPAGSEGLLPSSTPLPTNTLVVLPTFTPTKKGRITTGGGGGIATGGGLCTVVYQNPEDDTRLSPDTAFTTRWTLKNNSSKTWGAHDADVKVSGGNRLHTGPDLLDLPYDVGASGMVDIMINMVTPHDPGIYTENWAIVQGSTFLCQFFVTVNVK